MKLPLISKILEDTSKLRSKDDRVKFLRSHYPNKTMLRLLKCTFDTNVIWELPEGTPPYRPFAESEPDISGLYQEERKLYLFIKGGNPNLNQVRRETLFVQLLESIHPKEAELLIAVKDRKLPYKGITKEIVQEAFPKLL
jgi:hypothetical protein